MNRAMAVWGVAFGVAATLSGVFVLSALEGGFLAEGFFLLVISWILYVVLIAKILMRLNKKQENNDL